MARLFFSAILAAAAAAPPNIIIVLTDDQDSMLGASFPTTAPNDATPMPKTRDLLVARGATFTNMMVHTPICSPSRAELLTGRMLHNLKTTGQTLWAMHLDEDRVHNHSFAAHLKDAAGYRTGLFGKYLNVMPSATPREWDAWLANGGGDYVAPSFHTSGVSAYGYPDGTWTGDANNYSTAVIGNLSLAWLRAGLANATGPPSLAYIAPKAAHEPFLPAPWYADHWDESWPETEPRPAGVWNASFAARAEHYGVVAEQPLLSDAAATLITDIFRNRWRTVMSVDDVIAAVVGAVDDAGQTDNTYFFFTSDHGFQLGQFNFIMDKRHAYDWVTRVPLVVAGPGVRAGVSVALPAMMTDLAPTIVELAGLDPTDWGDSLPSPDGTSLAPILAAAGDAAALARLAWRTENFLEYYFVDDNAKCVQNCSVDGEWPAADACCADLTTVPNGACWGTEQQTGVTPASDQGCDVDCYPTEDTRNNFIGLRREDLLYVEYQTGNQTDADVSFDTPDFYELFNATADPWLTTNIFNELRESQPDIIAELHESVRKWFACSTTDCP